MKAQGPDVIVIRRAHSRGPAPVPPQRSKAEAEPRDRRQNRLDSLTRELRGEAYRIGASLRRSRGERDRIEGCSERPLARVSAWTPAVGELALPRSIEEAIHDAWSQDAASGRFQIRFEIPGIGWLRLSAEMR